MEFTTDNIKLFKPSYRYDKIDKTIIKKFENLFKKRNYFGLSPLVVNNNYNIYDESECAKYYSYLKFGRKDIIKYTFIEQKELNEQKEIGNLYLSDKDFDKNNLPKTEECVKRYLPYKSHYQKLVKLCDEFGFSWTNGIMIFGVSKNYKVIREGIFRCIQDYEIDEFRIIDKELRKSIKYDKLKLGWIYHYVIRKLFKQENFNWNIMIKVIDDNDVNKIVPFSSRKIRKSTSEIVKLYNSYSDNKLYNPYDIKHLDSIKK